MCSLNLFAQFFRLAYSGVVNLYIACNLNYIHKQSNINNHKFV
jgi:hypothetical protein